MNLSDNPGRRLLTLCGLYVGQGIPFGFVQFTLAAYLAAKKVGVGPIGMILAMSTLPWALKWVWGPVIDRYTYLPMGRRRPWILLAQTFMALTIGAMIAIPNVTTDIMLLTVMVFIHNIFSSLQDVSVDALAVDLLTEKERGRVSGLMYGSSYLGAFIGGAVLGLVMSGCGLRYALLVQVYMLLAIMLLPLYLRERAGEKLLPWTKGRAMAAAIARSVGSIRAVFLSLAKAFSLRSTVMAGIVALYVRIAGGVLAAVGVVFLIQELGWEKEEFTGIQGGIAVWIGLAGSIGGGFLADLVGAKRLAGIATVLLGASWIVFGVSAPLWQYKLFVIAFILLQTLLEAVLTVSLFAVFISVSWPVVAATQFTAYMALMNLSNTLGAWIAGPLKSLLNNDVGLIFCIAGFIQTGLVAYILVIDPRETRRVLGNGADGDEDAQAAPDS